MRSVAELLARPEPERRSGETLRWSRFLSSTRAEGPGLRSALWVQGCSVRCPGCFNPHLWAETGARLDTTSELAARFTTETAAAGAEGITLLGGEPFDQAEALAEVAESVRREGLTVMTFTGYTLDALRTWSSGRDDIARLLDATDLLVDGPFLRDRPDPGRPWLGSSNQGITALTPAYADAVAAIESGGGLDRVEIRIDPTGAVAVNGWADDAALAALLDDLGVRADGPLRKEKNR
ncbi:anaerobic ribonucleoside-triphosphate reductase activating protein [Labedella gwakjiensis]|uniref:Anaerobic ribonucleoside-triphosphate reductase activating protein n=1 Tax=Labedella gwakjiensis TaxID=390269 RepID=A0A2P8GRC3_9MICO|nr:4Fe-4S single cluster domain-containing protein [Labedella gwakjiensis]PSL36520.1 anaerobic ribonucleoside-triphosphate reductase activating protein [Labedella gwakjiensis]RUQ85562.1 radical SAM protein [Labedella gwakjiensis]